MNSVVVIVVTYNRCELLRECIEHLKNSEHPADILIVDNASTDGTARMVTEYVNNTDVFYANTGANIGGAGGFNYGIKKAYAMGYEYFWLMDDDTMVNPDSLTVLLDTASRCGNDFGFISSMALWTDGEPCHMNYHDISSQWSEDKKLLRDGIIRISAATFVSFFTRREVVETVGLPIKEYFIWGDDTEYSLRISGNFPCYLNANSTVIHKMKENQATHRFYEIRDAVRVERMWYSIRNDCCTYRRMGFRMLFTYSCNVAGMALGVLTRKNPYKGKKLCVLIGGYFKGLFFRPVVERV